MPELTLQTDSKFDATLDQLVKENPDAETKADIIQRAVATYKYFQDAVKNKQQIQLVDSSDTGKIMEQDIKLP